MKKSVILTLAGVFILSVVTVGSFGANLRNAENPIYVSSLTPTSLENVIDPTVNIPITDQNKETDPNLKKHWDYYLYLEGSLVKQATTFALHVTANPIEADNPVLSYSIPSSNKYAFIDASKGSGAITFLSPKPAVITISATDSAAAPSIKIAIYWNLDG
jgi:hypothetical protein